MNTTAGPSAVQTDEPHNDKPRKEAPSMASQSMLHPDRATAKNVDDLPIYLKAESVEVRYGISAWMAAHHIAPALVVEPAKGLPGFGVGVDAVRGGADGEVVALVPGLTAERRRV